MKKIFAIAWISLLFCVSSDALGQSFSVLISRGANRYDGCKGDATVVMGSAIEKGDRVRMVHNGYLALLHSSGAIVELKKPGFYAYNSMVELMGKTDNNVVMRYGRYLLEKIRPAQDESELLNVTGAVERGRERLIRMHLPNASDVYGTQVLVRWEPKKSVSKYLITVKNMFDEVVFTEVVATPLFQLDFTDPTFGDESLFILNVRDANNPATRSRDYGLKRLLGDEALAVHRELSHVLEAVEEDTAIGNVLVASFFEERRLLLDASTYYEKAIETASAIESYTQLYGMYLRRNRLNE